MGCTHQDLRIGAHPRSSYGDITRIRRHKIALYTYSQELKTNITNISQWFFTEVKRATLKKVARNVSREETHVLMLMVVYRAPHV